MNVAQMIRSMDYLEDAFYIDSATSINFYIRNKNTKFTMNPAFTSLQVNHNVCSFDEQYSTRPDNGFLFDTIKKKLLNNNEQRVRRRNMSNLLPVSVCASSALECVKSSPQFSRYFSAGTCFVLQS